MASQLLYINIVKKENKMASSSPFAVARRLNFNISERAHAELSSLAQETRRSMTELVRLGIGLVKIALEAEKHGSRLVIVDKEGKPVKEIVLP